MEAFSTVKNDVNFNVLVNGKPVTSPVNPKPETPTPSAFWDSDLTKKKPLSPLQQRLIEGLKPLPEDISLCLLNGNKKPQGAGWQNKPFTKDQVAEVIVNGITLTDSNGDEYSLEGGDIKGYGIITGTPLTLNGERYYVMALDNDGLSAGVKVTELSGGIGLPKTVSFTSTREGRFQSLFFIPETFAANVQTKKLNTKPKTETEEGELLEFRWTNLQSALPPSVHPLTGEYVYVEGCAFGEVEIAIAPDWVIEQMLTDKAPTPTPTVEAPPKFSRTTQSKTQWSDSDWALTYLDALSPSRADSYDDWIKVGMALHSIGDDSLLVDWDAWSRNSTKYKPGECDKKWASFGKRNGIKLGTLGQMAKADGWQSPKSTGRNYSGGPGSVNGKRIPPAFTPKTTLRNPNGDSGDDNGSGNGKPTRREVLGFSKQMYAELFADNHYIFVHNQFRAWTGTHYEPVHIAVVTKKIHDFCDTFKLEKKDTITYPYADPLYVKKGLEWLKQKVGIDPKLVNPPGVNCVDGFLQLSYDPDGGKWIRTLKEHDPKIYCLYAPQATYHIPAIVSPDACNRLLECLDPIQRDIFLKTIGAALDLETVRIVRGREIKALLLQGLGNNGKDTLRELTAMMFGRRGMVSVSLSDFMQYDSGRKFPLQKLDGAIVNWPSENADGMLLDRIQALKLSITGEEVSGEQKGQNEYPFYPRCVHLFNVNSPPRLQGSMEAILSRFAIIKLTKTYKTNPGPGELQADPRFRYDQEFLRREVLPWYLHYVLDALDLLMAEGIAYDTTEDAWEELRTETDHIYAFCREVGIGYKPNAQLGAEEVYTSLRAWYIANGTLELEELGDGRTRDRWSPNPSWGDNLIKGRNQIFPRLLKIFPQAKRVRDSQGRSILVGIGWIPPSPIEQKGGDFYGATVEVSAKTVNDSVSAGYVSEDGLKQPEDGLKMVNASNGKGSEDAEAVFAQFDEKNNPHVVSPALIQKAYLVASALTACTTKEEAQAILAKFDVKESEKIYVWNFLTETGRALVTTINATSTEGDEIKEVSTPNHLQDVQNDVTVRVSPSSGDVQPSSDHLQNGNVEIQNVPSRLEETIDEDGEEDDLTPASVEEIRAFIDACMECGNGEEYASIAPKHRIAAKVIVHEIWTSEEADHIGAIAQGFDLRDIAHRLRLCADQQTLNQLLTCWEPGTLRAACKFLSPSQSVWVRKLLQETLSAQA